MCGPMAGAFASILGSAVSAAGIMMEANARAQQAELQGKMHERQRFLERETGAHEGELTAREGERTGGMIRAGAAASGLDITTGSPMEMRMANAMETRRDVDAIRWNAQIREGNEDFKAKMSFFNAKQERRAGAIGALAPLISGAASFGNYFGGGSFGGGSFGGNSGRASPLFMN